jgi:hypothetical protein
LYFRGREKTIMIYRRNEKGRYEGVTDKGDVIAFEDASEMIA